MNRNKFGRAVVSGLMIATLATCGGGGPSTPTASPSAPPVQQVRTVLGNADFTLLAGRATFKAYDNPPIGMMDVTVDWGNAANQIDVYATDGRCPGFPNLQAGQCTVLARAEGVTKPKRLTFSNTVANAVYNFWIYNAGTTTESGALELAITTNGPITVASPSTLPGGGTTDPRTNLPAGPVTQAKVAIRSIDTGGFNYRDPQQDDAGNWIVHPGEFVVFDFSQRNGAGEKCQWIKDPEWDVSDDDEIVEVKGSSQPFLLRVDILHKGFFEVTGEIDGIKANTLSVVSVSQGQ
jgi:hypothetical protein